MDTELTTPDPLEPTDAHPLGARVAIAVALLATFMGIAKVKDDNVVQAMQQVQSDRLDQWAFYQARNLREEVARATVATLRGLADATGRSDQLVGSIATYEALAAEQAQKKEALRVQAEADARTYDALNYRDDQFDLSDALISIAIALLAVTAVTHQAWLFWFALAPAGAGVVMGVAGLANLRLHSDILARWLS